MQRSIEQVRVELAERLCERREEIEEAALTRTYAIADPKETENPEYAQGLRAAVSAALEYGLAGIAHGEERASPAPVLLLAQARLAARNDVPLDTVLRRYFAGYTLFGDFLVQEAGQMKLGEAGLKRILREQAAIFDRFLATVGEEYAREAEEAQRPTSEERRTERVRRLLDGEPVDTSELGYELEGHHVGLVLQAPDASNSIRELAAPFDRRLLSVRNAEGTVWAWLGGQGILDPGEVLSGARERLPPEAVLAVGESGQGLIGWRLSHRQAVAALPVAQRGPERLVSYADVGLLASVLQDDVLVDSLRQGYLPLLADAVPGGTTLGDTLRIYLETGRNVSSAAAAMRTSRRTVANRLRTIEERLGRPLNANTAEIEIALRLLDFEDSTR